jgi:serine/threonine protein kinase
MRLDLDEALPAESCAINRQSSPTISQTSAAARVGGMELFFAIAEENVSEAKSLLDAGVDANFRDYEQRCPLHIAAGVGNLDLIQMLVDSGADVNVIDRWGRTPLAQAGDSGKFDAEYLLKANGSKQQSIVVQTKAVREKWEINRSEVNIGKVISKTLKSNVHRATWRGVDVIAKFSLSEHKGAIKEEVEAEILHEISLLATLRHPDLVMFLGCCLQESPIMFITQYMEGGDLQNYYDSRRVEGKANPPSKSIVSRWSCSILRALDFLHQCAVPIIHRDLKPLNILLTDTLEAKVADFGISKAVSPFAVAKNPDSNSDSDSDASTRLPTVNSSPCSGAAKDFIREISGESKLSLDIIKASSHTGGLGSYRYMAPEVARHGTYTEKVDIYAFGLILYFMSSGRSPFHEYKSDLVEVLNSFTKGNEPRPKASECPPMFRPFMEAAWHASPEMRPSACDLVESITEASMAVQHNACCTTM